MRKACEFLERRLAWVIEEWKERGHHTFPNPDATEMMSNIMGEIEVMLGERFECRFSSDECRVYVHICGLGAYSGQNIRAALHNWVSRARLRLHVAAEEAEKAEAVARAA
jgi:hypothetical protein